MAGPAHALVAWVPLSQAHAMAPALGVALCRAAGRRRSEGPVDGSVAGQGRAQFPEQDVGQGSALGVFEDLFRDGGEFDVCWETSRSTLDPSAGLIWPSTTRTPMA